MNFLNPAIGRSLAGMAGGQYLPREDVRALNKALRDSAASVMKGEVGYPLQGQAYVGGAGGNGEIAPLVPQSIQQMLDSSTYLANAVKFWKTLTRVNVSSTRHEATRINEHGSMALDPFFAEGSVPGISEAEYERQFVDIKYLAEYIELSDVSTKVGILGVNRSALAQRTQDGTLALLGKLERMLFNADSNLSPLHFDGLYSQITSGAPDNYDDLRGDGATPQFLQEKLGELMADPNFAQANQILVDPRQYQSMSNIATAHGRHDQVSMRGNNAITFGHKQLFVGGPQGDVPIMPCPLMRPKRTAVAAAQGNNPPNSGAMPSTAYANPGATGGSQWVAADAGSYYYTVEGVGDEGVTAVDSSGAIAVAAGEAVTITISDGAADANGKHSGIRYYNVYRSAKDASSASGALFLGSFAANDDGGSDETVITDLNDKIPGTAPIYILQNTPDVMYWAQLLDFTRRPLAQTATSIPFLLMLFGALFVKVPTKCWVIDNVALSY